MTRRSEVPHPCPTRTPHLEPCWSSALPNDTREAPSLHPWSPSAPRVLPITLTCRSCWCSWYTALLLWRRQSSPSFGVSGGATLPCSHPCSRTSPGGTPLSGHPKRDKMSPLIINLHGRGAGLLGYQPHYDQRGTQAPTHRPGDRTKVLGRAEGGAGQGAAVSSAWLRRAAEMPKQSSLDGST